MSVMFALTFHSNKECWHMHGNKHIMFMQTNKKLQDYLSFKFFQKILFDFGAFYIDIFYL